MSCLGLRFTSSQLPMHRATASQGWSPLTGQALVPAFLIRSLGLCPTLLHLKLLLVLDFQVTKENHFDANVPTAFWLSLLSCSHLIGCEMSYSFHPHETISQAHAQGWGISWSLTGWVLLCKYHRLTDGAARAPGRVLLISPVLPASLWLSVTQFPPKALSNFPANWTARPSFLKKKHEFSQKGKYWIIFSENFMIFKLYRLSWMCSLSFGLCVYFLDMKLKVQIFFYLTSLRPNPSLNRHGYLHLCLFTIKKWLFFPYCKVKETIKTRISGNHFYNAWIF